MRSKNFMASAPYVTFMNRFSPNLAWTFRPRIPESLLFLVKIGWQFRPYAHPQWICACKIRKMRQNSVKSSVKRNNLWLEGNHTYARSAYTCAKHMCIKNFPRLIKNKMAAFRIFKWLYLWQLLNDCYQTFCDQAVRYAQSVTIARHDKK